MREHIWQATGGLIQPPGVDAITEQQIEPGERVVDTLYNLETGGVFWLNGRRYLKESTIRDAARALGFRLYKIPEEEPGTKNAGPRPPKAPLYPEAMEAR